jgi:hypothetical protein
MNLTNEEILHNFTALAIKKLSMDEKINRAISIFKPQTGDVVQSQLESLGDNCIHLIGGTRNLLNFILGKEVSMVLVQKMTLDFKLCRKQ